MRYYLIIVVAVVSLGLVGCLEREETITVHPDGTVECVAIFKSQSFSDMYEGDALPSLEDGWLVQEFEFEQPDGDIEYQVQAERVFGPDIPLPTTYANRFDVNPDTHTHFPTTLLIEQRADGTYYHFSRQYVARDWAYLETPRQELRKATNELTAKEFDDLTHEDREEIIELYARLELMKMATFARRAFLELKDEAPQDAWLHVNAAIRSSADAIDAEFVALLLEEADDPRVKKLLDKQQEEFVELVIERMQTALRVDCGYSHARTTGFMQSFNRHKHYYTITEDLYDDSFRISVKMPGEIVGHNGDEVQGSTITWEFAGSFFFDRDHELLVTSRMP